MDQKPNVLDKVLQAFEFLTYNSRWNGAAEIVQRDVTFAEGGTKRYTDVRLRIGNKWLILPRTGLDEIIASLVKAKDALDNSIEENSQPEVIFRNTYNSGNSTPNYAPPPQEKRYEKERDFSRPKRKVHDYERRGRRNNRYEDNDE